MLDTNDVIPLARKLLLAEFLEMRSLIWQNWIKCYSVQSFNLIVLLLVGCSSWLTRTFSNRMRARVNALDIT